MMILARTFVVGPFAAGLIMYGLAKLISRRRDPL